MPFPEAKNTQPCARMKEGMIIRIQLTRSRRPARGNLYFTRIWARTPARRRPAAVVHRLREAEFRKAFFQSGRVKTSRRRLRFPRLNSDKDSPGHTT